MSSERSFSSLLQELIDEVDRRSPSEYNRGYMDALLYVQSMIWEEGLDDGE